MEAQTREPQTTVGCAHLCPSLSSFLGSCGYRLIDETGLDQMILPGGRQPLPFYFPTPTLISLLLSLWPPLSLCLPVSDPLSLAGACTHMHAHTASASPTLFLQPFSSLCQRDRILTDQAPENPLQGNQKVAWAAAGVPRARAKEPVPCIGACGRLDPAWRGIPH